MKKGEKASKPTPKATPTDGLPPRGNESPGRATYFEALQRVFHLESQILTAVLPHKGERGRNDEERTRTFLAKVLPRRFSIGTGFILCSNLALEASGQTDVVIYDEIH